MLNINWFLEDTAPESGGNGSTIIMFVVIGVLLVAMIGFQFWKRKKMGNPVNTLHQSIEVGCTIKTVGGIVGKVIKIEEVEPTGPVNPRSPRANIKDRELTIETGVEGNKSTFVVDIVAIYTIMYKADGTKWVPVTQRPQPNQKKNEDKKSQVEKDFADKKEVFAELNDKDSVEVSENKVVSSDNSVVSESQQEINSLESETVEK